MAKQTNIRRRGASWIVNIRVNGAKVWQSFPTRDAAEVFLEQIKAQVGGRWVDAEMQNRRLTRKQKELISRNFAKPSHGLEPSTPPYHGG
jgi:hypothetical protein